MPDHIKSKRAVIAAAYSNAEKPNGMKRGVPMRQAPNAFAAPLLSELHALDADGLVAMFRTGELLRSTPTTRRSLACALLEPHINAMTHVNAAGRAEAEASARRWREGKARGPLDGSPHAQGQSCRRRNAGDIRQPRLSSGSSPTTTNCRFRGCGKPARWSSARPTCRNSRSRALPTTPCSARPAIRGTRLDPGRIDRRRCGVGGRWLRSRGARHRRRRFVAPARRPLRPRRPRRLRSGAFPVAAACRNSCSILKSPGR